MPTLLHQLLMRRGARITAVVAALFVPFMVQDALDSEPVAWIAQVTTAPPLLLPADRADRIPTIVGMRRVTALPRLRGAAK